MSTHVTADDKKKFIQWLVKKYKFKRRESIWILNYIKNNHNDILDNIHFVEDAHYCPRAIVMSTSKTDSIPFRYYDGNLATADAEKSFHELRLNPDKKMYIQINILNGYEQMEYLTVLEENEYNTGSIKSLNYVLKDIEDLVEDIVSKLSHIEIKKRIDVALDSGDEESFMMYSDMLKEYQVFQTTI